MQCVICGYFGTHVLSSDKNEEKNLIKRRRECLRCRMRFNTEETPKTYKPVNASFQLKKVNSK